MRGIEPTFIIEPFCTEPGFVFFQGCPTLLVRQPYRFLFYGYKSDRNPCVYAIVSRSVQL